MLLGLTLQPKEFVMTSDSTVLPLAPLVVQGVGRVSGSEKRVNLNHHKIIYQNLRFFAVQRSNQGAQGERNRGVAGQTGVGVGVVEGGLEP